jgi:hypothetical protein
MLDDQIRLLRESNKCESDISITKNQIENHTNILDENNDK